MSARVATAGVGGASFEIQNCPMGPEPGFEPGNRPNKSQFSPAPRIEISLTTDAATDVD